MPTFAQIMAFLAPFETLLAPEAATLAAEGESKVQAWIQAELAKDGLPAEVNVFLNAIDEGLTALANVEIAKI
jgi:hypothetical protein